MATYSSAISQSVSTTYQTAAGGLTSIYNPVSGYSLFKVACIIADPGGTLAASKDLMVQIYDTSTSTWKDLFKYGKSTNTAPVGAGTVINFSQHELGNPGDEYSGNFSGYAVDPISTGGDFSGGALLTDMGVPFIKLFSNMRVIISGATLAGNARVYYHVINYT